MNCGPVLAMQSIATRALILGKWKSKLFPFLIRARSSVG